MQQQIIAADQKVKEYEITITQTDQRLVESCTVQGSSRFAEIQDSVQNIDSNLNNDLVDCLLNGSVEENFFKTFNTTLDEHLEFARVFEAKQKKLNVTHCTISNEISLTLANPM